MSDLGRSGPRSIWLDGGLVDAQGPHLSVTDRGFQLGDGLFETARARRGITIELDEHLERLRAGCDVLGLNLAVSDDQLADGIAELLAAEELDAAGRDDGPVGDATVRITVSRGPLERRGLLPPGFEQLVATVVIQAWPYVATGPEMLEKGVRAVTSAIRRDPQSPLSGVKTTSRADYVFARLEADRAGADDAIFLTLDGAISEATAANLFVLAGADAGHATPLGGDPGRDDPDLAARPCRAARPRGGRARPPAGRAASGRRGVPDRQRGRNRAARRARRTSDRRAGGRVRGPLPSARPARIGSTRCRWPPCCPSRDPRGADRPHPPAGRRGRATPAQPVAWCPPGVARSCPMSSCARPGARWIAIT